MKQKILYLVHTKVGMNYQDSNRNIYSFGRVATLIKMGLIIEFISEKEMEDYRKQLKKGIFPCIETHYSPPTMEEMLGINEDDDWLTEEIVMGPIGDK